MRIFYFCLLLIFTGCVPDKEKSQVIIVEKKYMPYEGGDGATFEREKFLLYVERVNKSNFTFWCMPNSKCLIVETDKKSYNALKVGDKLQKKY